MSHYYPPKPVGWDDPDYEEEQEKRRRWKEAAQLEEAEYRRYDTFTPPKRDQHP